MNKMSKIQASQQTAGEALLYTKLMPPRLRGPLVAREELHARLNGGLERRVTLLSAPAGFGKTTLVRAWLSGITEHADAPPVAWVSLDTGDNDPVRFWRYVLSACETLQAGLGQQSLDILRHSRQVSFENALTLFINELTQLRNQGLLVLEDYHTINSARVHETLAFLLDYLPETLHVVLITRGDPPLPLARWRAHHELSELRAADLRFSLEETRSFLQQAIPVILASETLERLEKRTEGWVAGLRLLALASQGRQDPHEIEQALATFTGSHQRILEYLVADVLSVQPEELQTFLLQTSLFDRLSASLCTAVTGRADSAQVLAHLDHANLFLYPLDGASQWYRYHALFAEAMRHEALRRFGTEMLHSFYAKACRWYEEHSLLNEAIDAAFAGRDFARAADLMERLADPQRAHNEYYTLFHKIEQLPEEILQNHPELCLAYATSLLFLTDRRAPATRMLLERPLQMAERVWQDEGNSAKLGEIEALRAAALWWQSDFTQAFQVSRRALELLPAQATMWRGTCLIHLGTAELFDGWPERAKQIFLEAHITNEEARNSYGTRACLFLLCEANLAQGALHLAAQVYQQILGKAEADKDFTDQGAILQWQAELAYEWNDLEKSQQHITQASDIFARFTDDEMLVRNALTGARLHHIQGETAQAQQDLTALAARVQRWPHLLRQIFALQARLALASDDLVTAQQRTGNAAQYSDPGLFIHQEEDALLKARLLIAQGEIDEALHLLLYWQTEAQLRERTRSMLEILILQALAHHARKETPQAHQALHQALTLARAEGYQRLFLDEGPAMIDLLRALLREIHDEPLNVYIRSLLASARDAQTLDSRTITPASAEPLLLEPLSPQERRVLRLLAAGRSNPEIARELIVSVNTIKTQVQSIYYKLGVNSRQEAREAARKLRLV